MTEAFYDAPDSRRPQPRPAWAHSSGDIYLDRSRPGYLPAPEEVEEEQEINSTYSYPDNGPIDKSEFKTYLEELKAINNRLKALADPYSAGPLSDESLGIAPMKSDNVDEPN